jgi:hypothetical protein
VREEWEKLSITIRADYIEALCFLRLNSPLDVASKFSIELSKLSHIQPRGTFRSKPMKPAVTSPYQALPVLLGLGIDCRKELQLRGGHL